jgi:hypothetical protein
MRLLVAVVIKVQAEVAHDAHDLAPRLPRPGPGSRVVIIVAGGHGKPQASADCRTASRLARQCARERLVDDDGSGAGTHVAPMERTPGDHRPIEHLEEPRIHRGDVGLLCDARRQRLERLRPPLMERRRRGGVRPGRVPAG